MVFVPYHFICNVRIGNKGSRSFRTMIRFGQVLRYLPGEHVESYVLLSLSKLLDSSVRFFLLVKPGTIDCQQRRIKPSRLSLQVMTGKRNGVHEVRLK